MRERVEVASPHAGSDQSGRQRVVGPRHLDGELGGGEGHQRAVGRDAWDRRAEPVFEKALGNFCEYFEFVRRVFVPPVEEKSRESAARDQLKKLMGD